MNIRLNLNQFFYFLKELPYTIIKLKDHFPKYLPHEDVDIFCYSKKKILKNIIKVGNEYVSKNNRLEINLRHLNSSHTHLDFVDNKRIEFRFDIYESMPHYKKTNIKECFFYSLIENSVPIIKTFQGKEYPIYVPSRIDDLIIRYIEYLEWYKQRPDKIKHLQYLLKNIEKDKARIGFFEKLYCYTDIPKNSPKDSSVYLNMINHQLNKIKYIFKKLKDVYYDYFKN